jgi:branched-chain amino acid transport system ATP-binding protein
MTPALQATGLTAGYGPQPVIHDLNLEVGAGEVVTLLGANGAGKTTTLQALSGVLPLHKGEVLFGGKPEKGPLHKRARKGMGYVTEERSIFKTLSLIDNLRCGGVAVSDALELFPELEKRLQVRGGLLSGGEQQMLALARALCRKPNLLLVDEMSLGLAPLIVERLLKAVRQAAADSGCGVLLIEQHARKALHYADRVYVMRRGRMEMHLSAAEARRRIGEIEASYLSARADDPTTD